MILYLAALRGQLLGSMAPKGAYAAERLSDLGAKDIEAASKRFPGCELACVYTGGAGAVAKRSQVCFEPRRQLSGDLRH